MAKKQTLPTTNAQGYALVLETIREKLGCNTPHARLAAHLGISRQSPPQWSDVPIERVVKVAELTGLSPSVILPETAKIFQDN